MSGRMMRGGWSGSSSFMAGALPGGLTACMSFFLAPVSFTALGVGVEPTMLTLLPVLAVMLPAFLMMSFEALLMMSLVVVDTSAAGAGRGAGVGVEPTPGLADVLPCLGIT